MTVDCTDCRISEPYPYERVWSNRWFSPKFKGAGLRYEIAVSIMRGEIVWVNGPFPCGQYPDIKIFMECGLKDNLDEGERVEADNGYEGADPDFAKSKSGIFHPKSASSIRNTVCARHETVNKRIKQFGALAGIFRHDLLKHSTVFHAVALLTQLSIEDGEPLFNVEGYDDDNFYGKKDEF